MELVGEARAAVGRTVEQRMQITETITTIAEANKEQSSLFHEFNATWPTLERLTHQSATIIEEISTATHATAARRPRSTPRSRPRPRNEPPSSARSAHGRLLHALEHLHPPRLETTDWRPYLGIDGVLVGSIMGTLGSRATSFGLAEAPSNSPSKKELSD